MDASPFASLPAELRLRTFEYVMLYDGTLKAKKEMHPGTQLALWPRGYPPIAMSRTCRQARNETLPIFYGSNEFEIELGYIGQDSSTLERVDKRVGVVANWLFRMGLRQARLLRHVRIRIGIGTWSALRGLPPHLAVIAKFFTLYGMACSPATGCRCCAGCTLC